MPTDIDELFSRIGIQGINGLEKRKLNNKGVNTVFVVDIPMGLISDDIANDLNDLDEVLWAYPDVEFYGDYMELNFLPNSDPGLKNQLFHKIISSFEAWDKIESVSDVVVAVTDDGFDIDHEDLVENYFTNTNEIPGNGIDDDENGYIDDVVGWDFNTPDNDPDSNDGRGTHGTHVAGIVSAVHGNGIGGAGVAPQVKVMPLKFYGRNTWTASMIYETYAYAVDNGAKIITTSYNIDYVASNPVYQKSLEYAVNNNVLVFNSAGNGNTFNSMRYRLKNLLLVCSTTSANMELSDQRSRFSNYGWGVDICAPGDPVYSTTPNNNYGNLRGTSMATPVAAAVAALIWTKNPEWSFKQVAHQLLTSTDSIDNKNKEYISKLGTGRVNALKAVTLGPQVSSIRAVLNDTKKYDNIRTLILKKRGVISVPKSAITVKLFGSEKALDFTLEDSNGVGENFIQLNLPQLTSGVYEIKVDADQTLDAFNSPIDGDLDGVAGGDYKAYFQVN